MSKNIHARLFFCLVVVHFSSAFHALQPSMTNVMVFSDSRFGPCERLRGLKLHVGAFRAARQPSHSGFDCRFSGVCLRLALRYRRCRPPGRVTSTPRFVGLDMSSHVNNGAALPSSTKICVRAVDPKEMTAGTGDEGWGGLLGPVSRLCARVCPPSPFSVAQFLRWYD
jgi:hypothetical protein